MKGSDDPFWVKKQQKSSKIVAKMIQNRCLEGAWVAPGRLLAPDGFQVAPGTFLGGPGAPPGSLLRRLTGPCWVQDVPQEAFGRERKSARKLDHFRKAHGGRFFENLVVLGRQKGGFRVPKRSKISLQIKNVQKAPSSTIPIVIS